ncbi:MAG: protein kinase [Chloroflexi bacterium]|nr:protein kinase [Chloroflexota bacterium]
MDNLIGRRLGKYQIESLVGRGGMAVVYRAHDTVLNRSVAIKVLEPALAVDPKAVERFKREAVTAANLEHPSIVRVYDVQQEGALYYIAMRYVQGATLRDILRDNGPLPLEAIIKIIKPVAAAIHYAHTHGVIHRDVKPGNILVEPDGTVSLTDFGIARAADSSQSSLTAAGQVMGTADYLAPEQISGRPAEARSDVYSLGVVLYEMLTGVTPFAGETTASILYRQVHDNPVPIRSVNPRLPSELQPVIDRALAKNPTLRYADPVDMARELEEVAHWLPPGSPWLSRGSKTTYIPAHDVPQNGSRKQSVPANVYAHSSAAAANGRAAPRRDTGPRPYTADGYEEAPSYEPQVITPPMRGKRTTLVLVLSILLIAAGAVVLAMAAGIIPGVNLKGVARPMFQAPGPVTYSGPLRKANGPDIHTLQALTQPVIDGDLSDWQGAQPVPAPYVTLNKSRWKGPQDLSTQFYFAWDADNFYIAAVITDDVHVQLPSSRGYQLYKGDDIEVWFDTKLAEDFNDREGNADDFQLGISPGDFGALGPEAVFWNPDRSDARNKLVRVAALPRPTGNGYTLEAAVPWIAFGDFRPQPGQAIGFAASAGDNDQKGTPVQEMMISTAPTLQYKQPFTFGNLFF